MSRQRKPTHSPPQPKYVTGSDGAKLGQIAPISQKSTNIVLTPSGFFRYRRVTVPLGAPDGGNFATIGDAPFWARALLGMETDYHPPVRYRLKTELRLTYGRAVPWFGKPGGGQPSFNGAKRN